MSVCKPIKQLFKKFIDIDFFDAIANRKWMNLIALLMSYSYQDEEGHQTHITGGSALNSNFFNAHLG